MGLGIFAHVAFEFGTKGTSGRTHYHRKGFPPMAGKFSGNRSQNYNTTTLLGIETP